jgi:chemotaxis protein MotB
VKFTHTPEGLRIELIDDADYSMFASGTTALDPRARALLQTVADVIGDVPNRLAIRGHTDSTPFASRRPGDPANNWALSSARAEATRQQLATAGIPDTRFSRLEGVADTEPMIADAPNDPRNRRMSVTLLRG